MKKIMFLLAMLPMMVFTACSPRYYEHSVSVDYRSFCSDGFRITPFEYSSTDFEVIGEIYTEYHNGVPSKKDQYKFERDYRKSGNYTWKIKYDYMIENAIKKAKELGANGIMKYELTSFTNGNDSGYIVSGIAVKFK